MSRNSNCIQQPCRKESLQRSEEILKLVAVGKWNDDVIQVRTAGIKWGKLKLQSMNSGRSHPRVKAQRFQRKSSHNIRDSDAWALMESSLTDYITAFSTMQMQ